MNNYSNSATSYSRCSRVHLRYFATIYLLFLAFTTACGQSAASKVADGAEKILPQGAIAFDYDRHLYFNVVIRDSIPARMIFDTGNTTFMLDSAFYATYFAKQNTLRKAMVRGAGSSIQMSNLDAGNWNYSVGNKAGSERMAVVLNLRKILGSGVDGMFGMAFTRNSKVEFNYADEYMRFLSTETAMDGYVCIDCKWLDDSQSRMLMPAKLTIGNQVREGLFLVDLGASGTVALNSGTLAKMGVQSQVVSAKKMVYNVGGVGGSRTDYIFDLESVELGGFVIKDIESSYSANTQGAMASSKYDGIVGNALLARFDVIFDFAECKIYLRPNRNFNASKQANFGVVLTLQNDCWIVNGLIEGGKAYNVGLRRGDIVLTINNLSPQQMDNSGLYSMRSWDVTVKRGAEVISLHIEHE